MNGILTQSAGRRIGDTWVVADVTCTIDPGIITAILGPSGSGKTTLLRLLSFLDVPDAGTVSLGDREAGIGSPPWPQVTCVFQRQFLWPHLTLRQNIELPLIGLGQDERVARVDDVIKTFSMQRFVDRYPNEVSGGEGQRCALARAFALRPKFVLLDEAHTFLDLEQQAILNQHLQMLVGTGIGIGIATHSITFARRYASKLLVLEQGKLVEQGGPEILRSPSSRFLQSVDL